MINRKTTIVALAAAVLALTVGGCKRKSGAPAEEAGPPDISPTLGPVTVQDLTPPEALPAGAQLDAKALTAELQKQLAGAGIFSGHAGDGGAGPGLPIARVRVDLGVEEVRHEGKGAARAVIRFRVDTRPSGLAGQHWSEDVQAQGETVFALEPAPERKAIFAKLASRMLGDLTASYVTRQRLWRGGPKEIGAALNADAGEAKVEAIRVAGHRKMTSEVPALLRLLSHPDEQIRDAALGALVTMRERRAVSELAKQRSMRDQREMRKILDAISMLGGDEAVEYLSFVADAHEDEEIKQMAKKALERLKRRTAPAPAQ
jgi:hypothetical protein